MDINMKNIACVGKIMSICNKQQAIFEAKFIKKLSNTGAELKKTCI